MFIYRYTLVLFFCLSTTHMHAVRSQGKKLSPDQVRNAKIDLILQAGTKLSVKLSNQDKYLAPAINILHEALVLNEPEFRHSNAINSIDSRRKLIDSNRLRAAHIEHFHHHQPHFLRQIIMDAQGLARHYPDTKGPALKHKIYRDIEQAIDKVCDPLSQEILQQEFDSIKQKINLHVFQKNGVYPDKVTKKEARQQKIALMQFANYVLRSQEDEEHDDAQDAVSFGTLHNIAITCLEKEFSRYQTDELIALIAKHSSKPINFATARQYAANNPVFFKSLLTSLHGIKISTLLTITEELLEKLPKEMYDQLYARGLDDLEID